MSQNPTFERVRPGEATQPMSRISNTRRVYCAGPLFNTSERQEMLAIAECLSEAGFPVYLPHRDGMEFRKVLEVLVCRGWPRAQAGRFLHEAIFALDVYQLAVECAALVCNINGRVPDEGAVAEAAIAWTLGKPMVIYSDDARSLIEGRCNPLVAGLTGFNSVDHVQAIPAAVAKALDDSNTHGRTRISFPQRLERAVAHGGQLWQVLCREEACENDERIADVVAELFAPSTVAPRIRKPAGQR